MIRATYPNACPSYRKNGATKLIMRSQVEAIGKLYHLPTLLHKWMKDSTYHQRIKPKQDCDTSTTTSITKVESKLNKLKEPRVVNDEAGSDNHA